MRKPINWGCAIEKEFEIYGKLGSGSYASVWEARHRATGTRVAIKREEAIFTDLIDCKRILREIKLLRNLNHEGIVRLIDVRAAPYPEYDTLLLILDFHESDLKKLIRSTDSINELEVKTIIYELLKGVKYLHSAKVLHRDIKPGNVLLSANKKPKICDFGLARGGLDTTESVSYERIKKVRPSEQTHWDLASSGTFEMEETKNEEDKTSVEPMKISSPPKPKKELTSYVVTRWYRAPEIILTKSDYGTGIDIWAIGCIFAELLSMLNYSLDPTERKPLFPGSSCYPYSPGKVEKLKGGLSVLENDQLNIIIEVLGTPTQDDCSFIKDPYKVQLLLEKHGTKMDLSKKYPQAGLLAIDLLKGMLQFNPHKRAKVDECLRHPYFMEIRKETSEVTAPAPIDFDFEKEKSLSKTRLRELIDVELDYFKNLRTKGLIKWS